MEISRSQDKGFSSALPGASLPGAILSAPAPQVGGVGGAGGLPAVPGPAGFPAPMLDIPTPQDELGAATSKNLKDSFQRRKLARTSRRLYSRALLGLSIPGRYYFCTWTSSPESPPIEKTWRLLRWRLKRSHPGSSWIYVITSEGLGVIHMIIRLGKNEKRLDVKEERAWWEKVHKARQIKFLYVKKPEDLAAYLADQRRKRSLGAELAWQDDLVRWRWSSGWLPKGFTRAFGRVWSRLMGESPGYRDMVIRTWLARCHEHPEEIARPPGTSKRTRTINNGIVLSYFGDQSAIREKIHHSPRGDGYRLGQGRTGSLDTGELRHPDCSITS